MNNIEPANRLTISIEVYKIYNVKKEGKVVMKALVWTDVEKMEIHDIEMPIVGAHDVLIKVEVVGICGSELEGYLGHNTLRKPPLIMGHEFSGRVEAWGNQIEGMEKGLLVTVNPLTSCGVCNRCQKGLVMHCKQRKIVGITSPGGFSEYVVVPKSTVIKLPNELDVFRAALAEPLACSIRAVKRALKDHAFANVFIFGAGGIGLLCGKVAKIAGASSVIIADTNNSRLKMAEDTGTVYTMNPKEEPVASYIESHFPEKGIDVVIDAAGFQQTRETAMKILNPGGVLMNIGLGIDDTVVPLNHQIRNEITIVSSFCYSPQDFRDSIDMLISGRVTEEGWTEIRSLSEGNEAFTQLVSGKVRSGKIFLQP